MSRGGLNGLGCLRGVWVVWARAEGWAVGFWLEGHGQRVHVQAFCPPFGWVGGSFGPDGRRIPSSKREHDPGVPTGVLFQPLWGGGRP